MNEDAVGELEFFESFLGVVLLVEILAGGDGRLLDETVFEGDGKGVAVNDVAERLGLLGPLLDLGVAVSSRPRIGLSSLMARMPAEPGSGAIRP